MGWGGSGAQHVGDISGNEVEFRVFRFGVTVGTGELGSKIEGSSLEKLEMEEDSEGIPGTVRWKYLNPRQPLTKEVRSSKARQGSQG
jgi:hypothetical protein